MSWEPWWADYDWKTVAFVIVAGAAFIGVVVLTVYARRAENERCQQAGGHIVCHTTTMSGIDGKGRPVFGQATDCRCLNATGGEIEP